MSNKYLVIIMFTLAGRSIWSQGYEYVPFPDSNCIWSEQYTPPMYPDTGGSSIFYVYALFNEDTVINSIQYHKLYILYDSMIDKNNATYIGAIREDSSRKVYYKGDHLFWGIDTEMLNENGEIQVYDFSINVGDTISNAIFGPGESLIVSALDTIDLYTDSRRIIHFEDFPYIHWIEGIGNERGLLSPSGSYPTNGSSNDLICFKKNDTLVYRNSGYADCFYFLSSVSDQKSNKTMGAYPNPVTGISRIDLTQSFDILEIYHCNGTKILRKEITDLKSYEIISSQFNPGLYFFYHLFIQGTGQVWQIYCLLRAYPSLT
jgi:hypothetical protein